MISTNYFSFLKRKVKIGISKYFELELLQLEKKRIKKLVMKADEIILIYTIGKVGSSSVYNSLKHNKNLNIPIFHIHCLNPSRIEEQKIYYKSSARKSVPFHLIQSTVLSELLPEFKGTINIFTLVREPIQRELSSLFQDSFNFTNSQKIKDSGMNAVVKEKMSALVKSLPEEDWFDQELKKVFNIDVFSEDFDPSKGFMIIKKHKVNFALIRLENLKEQLETIGKKLFDYNYNLKVIQSNNSNDKFYNEDYKAVKNIISFSNFDLERILETRFIKKFYPDYTKTIKNRWGKH